MPPSDDALHTSSHKVDLRPSKKSRRLPALHPSHQKANAPLLDNNTKATRLYIATVTRAHTCHFQEPVIICNTSPSEVGDPKAGCSSANVEAGCSSASVEAAMDDNGMMGSATAVAEPSTKGTKRKRDNTAKGKGNLYDFYNTLLRKTDNAGLKPTIYCFPEMHRAFRLWRNMMLWKRAECPACPHPGRNLPDNWQDSGPLLFLYTLFIAVDANFKLKGKERKLGDVDLVPGTGVFVDQAAYCEHIGNYVEQPEMNTCRLENDAIVRASIRNTPGYAVSGVGLVLCSRHALVHKNGVGDLQKVMGVTLACIFITYDIACQWTKNLFKRIIEFPEKMRIAKGTQIQTAIPSWHINGHGPDCCNNYNVGYTKGVGKTCGKEVETNWSHTNPLAGSVREMAPSARRDTLNDHWNGWNFRKLIGFRTSLARKFKKAHKMQKKYKESFKQFSSTFTVDVIKQWTAKIKQWEENPKKPNPYKESTNTITLQDTRHELQKEEAVMAATGKLPAHKVTMTGFLVTGLELEDHQYKLTMEIASQTVKTTKKQGDIHEK
uniref:CxC2-like cysteine cluster KDZ transposase-associated domain-containing protein n=1 Tax=Psilocybe cubensis TaxID=181762 RepID=A0A8H7XRR3_PSICU